MTTKNTRFVLITDKNLVVYEASQLVGGQPMAIAQFDLDQSTGRLTLEDVEKIRTDNYDEPFQPEAA